MRRILLFSHLHVRDFTTITISGFSIRRICSITMLWQKKHSKKKWKLSHVTYAGNGSGMKQHSGEWRDKKGREIWSRTNNNEKKIHPTHGSIYTPPGTFLVTNGRRSSAKFTLCHFSSSVYLLRRFLTRHTTTPTRTFYFLVHYFFAIEKCTEGCSVTKSRNHNHSGFRKRVDRFFFSIHGNALGVSFFRYGVKFDQVLLDIEAGIRNEWVAPKFACFLNRKIFHLIKRHYRMRLETSWTNSNVVWPCSWTNAVQVTVNDWL